MSHYGVCGENEREYIKKHISKEPTPDSCICNTHQTEAERMWTNPNFIPKCSKACVAMKYKHLFPDCEERDKVVSPKFDSACNIELEIGVQCAPDTPLVVCPKHYTALHRQCHASELRASCGIKPLFYMAHIGAVASADTYYKFVASISEYQRERNIWNSLPQNVWTIASVGNFVRVMLMYTVVTSNIVIIGQQFS